MHQQNHSREPPRTAWYNARSPKPNRRTAQEKPRKLARSPDRLCRQTQQSVASVIRQKLA